MASSFRLYLRTMGNLLLLLILCVACLIPAIIYGSTEETQSISPKNSESSTVPIINQETLARNTGTIDGSRIWISILGEVFDVTEGNDYYGEGNSYHVFAGKDATPCFATGEFNEEGSKKSIHHVPAKDLIAIMDWKEFYDTHDKYFRVGLLEGDYYDGEGKPTPTLRQTWHRYDIGRIEAEKIRKERAAIRKQKLEDRKAKKKAEAEAAAVKSEF